MRNVLDKSCRENQSTHFTFNKFFSENRAVYEIMSKYMVEFEGLEMTSQYGAYELHVGQARLHALTRMHTPPRAHTHSHTHTHKCNIYCFSTAKIIRELS